MGSHAAMMKIAAAMMKFSVARMKLIAGQPSSTEAKVEATACADIIVH